MNAGYSDRSSFLSSVFLDGRSNSLSLIAHKAGALEFSVNCYAGWLEQLIVCNYAQVLFYELRRTVRPYKRFLKPITWYTAQR